MFTPVMAASMLQTSCSQQLQAHCSSMHTIPPLAASHACNPHRTTRRAARSPVDGPPLAAAAAVAYEAAVSHVRAGQTSPLSMFNPPRVDYSELLTRHKHDGCPALFLAPMENLADRPARIALKEAAGGFDEACTEFIRVPGNSDHPHATTRGITASYDAAELGDTPLAAQLMGSNRHLLAAAAHRLVHVKKAPRIDLNCGCPANVVTGGGAGSSLLRDPDQLHSVVSELVAAVGGLVPVSVKMRSGFNDTTLYEENLLAVQEAGACFVTIHPRTKQQSYNGRADWSLIARAKQLLQIPVVGNGDIVDVSGAVSMLQQTGCDGLMIGRGALQDPLIFKRIKQHFAEQQDKASSVQQADLTALSSGRECEVVEQFLRLYASYGFDGKADRAEQTLSQSGRIGRLKKVMKYIFSGQPELRTACCHLLRAQPGDITADEFLEQIVQQLSLHWCEGGPSEQVLVSHLTVSGRSKAEQTWRPVTVSTR